MQSGDGDGDGDGDGTTPRSQTLVSDTFSSAVGWTDLSLLDWQIDQIVHEQMIAALSGMVWYSVCRSAA